MNFSMPRKIVSALTYIKAFRLTSVLFISFFVFIPLLLYTRDAAFSLLRTLPFTFVALGGMILNDEQDIEKDKASKPLRPLACGLIKIKTARLLYTVLFTCAFALAVVFFDRLSFILWFTVLALVILYNYVVKTKAFLKTFMTALICSVSFVFIFINCGRTDIHYLYILSSFFFISARELLMDIRDTLGDRKEGIKTVPILLGEKTTKTVSFSFFGISLFVLLPLVLFYRQAGYFVLYLACACLIALLCVLWHRKKEKNVCINLLWLPMLLSLAFIL